MLVTQRFSNRVAEYVRFRPGYPAALIPVLEEKDVLQNGYRVADIGSGTGFSSRPFLEAGYSVFGIEPNAAMRNAAEEWLSDFSSFTSMDADAYDTGLEDASIDLIVCAQAFHWLDKAKALTEFQRMLKSNGHVVLIWNDRKADDPFMQAYQKIIDTFSIDYNEINHLLITDEHLQQWYQPETMQKITLSYKQRFDLQGLIGRTLSCSYMPDRRHPAFPEMQEQLTLLFHQFQQNGIVIFAYTTRVYIGKI